MIVVRKKLGIVVLAPLFLSSLSALFAAKGPKMEPMELVALHQKSIGTLDALAARKTIINEGTGTVRMLTGGSGSLEGPAVFLSEGSKLRLFMNLGQANYPAEQFVFDGSSFETGFLQQTKRSRLGVFLYGYNGIVREGLLGGALSTHWLLLAPDKRDVKLQYMGLKKVDGKELLELKCIMKKKESELNVFLYFEPDTYRHVKTAYLAHLPGALVNDITMSSQQKENRYTLEEWFSDFRVVNGLTLPTAWRMQLTTDAGPTTAIMEWSLRFEKTIIDQPLAPSVFVLK